MREQVPHLSWADPTICSPRPLLLDFPPTPHHPLLLLRFLNRQPCFQVRTPPPHWMFAMNAIIPRLDLPCLACVPLLMTAVCVCVHVRRTQRDDASRALSAGLAWLGVNGQPGSSARGAWPWPSVHDNCRRGLSWRSWWWWWWWKWRGREWPAIRGRCIGIRGERTRAVWRVKCWPKPVYGTQRSSRPRTHDARHRSARYARVLGGDGHQTPSTPHI